MTMTRPDVSQIIGVASGGLRNRIINGAMLVNQRNAASLSSGISSVTYGLDRFYVFAVGAAVTIDRIAGVGYSPNNTSALRVTGAAGNTNVSIGQRIEAANIRELAGSTVAVSFWVYQTTGSAKQVGATIYAPTATDNWTSQTTIGTFSTLVQHATWTRVEGTIPLTSAVQYGASLGIEFLGLLASQQLAVTQVQVEPGTVATTFEQRPIGLELALCQRYYQNINSQVVDAHGGSLGAATSTPFFSVPLKVEMRATPSIVASNFTIVTGPATATLLATALSPASLSYYVNRNVNAWLAGSNTFTFNLTTAAEL